MLLCIMPIEIGVTSGKMRATESAFPIGRSRGQCCLNVAKSRATITILQSLYLLEGPLSTLPHPGEVFSLFSSLLINAIAADMFDIGCHPALIPSPQS